MGFCLNNSKWKLVFYSVAILWEIYVMQPKCHVKWLRIHFKRMLITRLGQYTLLLIIIKYGEYVGNVYFHSPFLSQCEISVIFYFVRMTKRNYVVFSTEFKKKNCMLKYSVMQKVFILFEIFINLSSITHKVFFWTILNTKNRYRNNIDYECWM